MPLQHILTRLSYLKIEIENYVFGFFIMSLKIDPNTRPNHQYNDLEAKKLVHKLLDLVHDHNILVSKR